MYIYILIIPLSGGVRGGKKQTQHYLSVIAGHDQLSHKQKSETMKTTTNRNKLEYSPPVLGRENGCSVFNGEKPLRGGKTLALNNNKTQQNTPSSEGWAVSTAGRWVNGATKRYKMIQNNTNSNPEPGSTVVME